MNRLPSLSDLESFSLSQQTPPTEEKGSQSLLTRSPQAHFPHALFAPIHYEKNYAYPLLIWLHGPESEERQLLRVMPHISMRNYVAIGPRAPWPGVDGGGYSWRQTDRATTQAGQLVFDCLETARREYHLDGRRVFLAGYGCGGEMALRVALRHPQSFAGALSIDGPFPRGAGPLSNLEMIRKLPLFIAQGQDSRLYPLHDLCEDLRLFHAAGMFVTARQYSCADEIHQRMLHDMNVWMMDRVTGEQMTSSSASSPSPPLDSN
jgi:phospholipase/carboxylesterase